MLGWAFYAIGLVASAAALYFTWTRWHPAVALLFIPIGAWFIARILVESGMLTLDWLMRGQMAKWNGRYYEFGGRHFRPVELESGLAFVERDLLDAVELKDPKTVLLFGPAERLTDPDSGEALLTSAGCERLLMKSTHPDSKKILLWLRREVFAPYAKRRAL